MEAIGTCWNFCGTHSVWKPNKTSASRNIVELAGACSEPVRFLAPGLSQTQLSQTAIPMEPIGTCLNLCGTYSLRGPNSTRNLLEPARNIFVFGHLVSAKHNFPENATLMEPFRTCLNFCGTCSLRGPNSTSVSRNLLEPARNLFAFKQLASAKRNFPKNPLHSEPTGTL